MNKNFEKLGREEKNMNQPYYNELLNGNQTDTQYISQMQFRLSKQAQEKMYIQQALKAQDEKTAQTLLYLQSDLKMRLEEQKYRNAVNRDAALSLLKEQRLNASQKIFENGDGFLCIQTVFSNFKEQFSAPIMKKPYMQMTILRTEEDNQCSVQSIGWEDNKDGFLLCGSECNVSGFLKELGKSANAILVGRDRKKQIGELVYSYLIEHSEICILPEHYGWNKTKKGWIFVGEEDITIAKCLGKEV